MNKGRVGYMSAYCEGLSHLLFADLLYKAMMLAFTTNM